jgi:hypothetical protein
LRKAGHSGQTNQGNILLNFPIFPINTPKALTDAIFVGMTTEQWSEYDNRHARILEILRGDGQVQG